MSLLMEGAGKVSGKCSLFFIEVKFDPALVPVTYWVGHNCVCFLDSAVFGYSLEFIAKNGTSIS